MSKRSYIELIVFLALAITTICVAEDWDDPTVTSNYVDVISDLKARDVTTAKMDYSGATDYPIGVVRWNGTSEKFQTWNGATWDDLQADLYTHEASTSDPHEVTPAQIGAPTTAQHTSHTTNTSNPHDTTAANLDGGAALKASNNLSDVADAPTARSNISAAYATDLSDHEADETNPHTVTATQAGAMKGSNNLSEITNAATARSNLTAAASGSNSDISALTGCSTYQASAPITIYSSTALGTITLKPGLGTSYEWELSNAGVWTPPSYIWPDWTLWPGPPAWPNCTSCARTRTVSPAAATPLINANVLNTLIEDLMAQGFLQ